MNRDYQTEIFLSLYYGVIWFILIFSVLKEKYWVLTFAVPVIYHYYVYMKKLSKDN